MDDAYQNNFDAFCSLARQAGLQDEVKRSNIIFIPPRASYASYHMTEEDMKRFITCHLAFFPTLAHLFVSDSLDHYGIRTLDGTVHRVLEHSSKFPPIIANPSLSSSSVEQMDPDPCIDRILKAVMRLRCVEAHAVWKIDADGYTSPHSVDESEPRNDLSFHVFLSGCLTSLCMTQEIAKEQVHDKSPLPHVGSTVRFSPPEADYVVKARLYSSTTRCAIRPSRPPPADTPRNEMMTFGYTRDGRHVIQVRNYNGYNPSNKIPIGSNVVTDVVPLTNTRHSAEHVSAEHVGAPKLDPVRYGNFFYDAEWVGKGTRVNLLKIGHVPPQLIARQLATCTTDEQRQKVHYEASLKKDLYGGTADNRYYFVFHLVDVFTGDAIAWHESTEFVLKNSCHVLSEEEKLRRNEYWLKHSGPGGPSGGRYGQKQKEGEEAQSRKRLREAIDTATSALVELSSAIPVTPPTSPFPVGNVAASSSSSSSSSSTAATAPAAASSSSSPHE